MTDPELSARYRNLLVTLARDAQEIGQEVKTMRLAESSERATNKRNGLRTIINQRNRQRARLMQILSRNTVALRHFFGTINPDEIAEEEIVLHKV